MSSSTEIACVIGHPVSQSLSPLIHNHWLAKYGLSGIYGLADVDPLFLEDWIMEARLSALKGWNVTIPHKTAILPMLDKIAPMAQAMGAVNTIKVTNGGKLLGFNTDGIGLMTHLNKTCPDWPKDKPVLILGAGGAARAAAMMLVNENVPMVMIANRTRTKAEAIAKDIGRGRLVVVDWADKTASTKAAGLIINTTSLGMVGKSELDLDFEGCASDSVFYDIVYKPLTTKAIQSAKAQGLRTVDGLGMLVYQAAAAFKIWFDIDPDYDATLKEKLIGALE